MFSGVVKSSRSFDIGKHSLAGIGVTVVVRIKHDDILGRSSAWPTISLSREFSSEIGLINGDIV